MLVDMHLKMSIKDAFFDRQAVLRSVDKAKRKVLNHAGGLIRKIARNSMKRPGKKGPRTAPPGTPPRVHEGSLRKLIMYGYDRMTDSVVAGPVAFGGKRGAGTREGAPHVLEFGGYAAVTGRQSGKRVTRRKYVRPRPYMAPALEKIQPMLPALWRGAVRK